MIRRHDFNSDWLDNEAGIVSDDAFFALPSEERAALLEPWDWVEARGPLTPEHRERVARAGFVQVDTQIHFRIGLAKLESTPSVDRLDVRFADEAALTVQAEDVADFRHERFAALRNVDGESLNRRYALWSRVLIESGPDVCMEVLNEGRVQGWFLGRRTDAGLDLALAMLKRGANVSGLLLYQRALLAFAVRGERVGHASFSVANTAVLNIYASLGARFLAPVGCWLWQPPAA